MDIYIEVLTTSSTLYYVSINYTSATFAAASTNTVPAVTFIMAALIRVESISIKNVHGVAKIFGSALSLSGAITFALVKGPTLDFMRWYPQNQNHSSSSTTSVLHSKGDNIKGALMMLSANTAWSLWLILQGFVVKEYPAKFRLTSVQCLFSFIQSSVLALSVERDPSAWKLGWDIHLLSVAYCEGSTKITPNISMPKESESHDALVAGGNEDLVSPCISSGFVI